MADERMPHPLGALQVLQRLGGGKFLEDLADQLELASKDVLSAGQGATVTARFRLTPAAGSDIGIVVEESLARTTPKRKPRGAIFYSHDGLHSEDPRQTRMEGFAIVSGELVDTATGVIMDEPAERPVVREAQA